MKINKEQKEFYLEIPVSDADRAKLLNGKEQALVRLVAKEPEEAEAYSGEYIPDWYVEDRN